jgi:mannose-6-phosphate isomerase-like protein (cupin superfamily)
MAQRGFDLSEMFVHLTDRGDADAIAVTPAFWRSAGTRYERVLGAFDFRSPRDLHPSQQEIHPEADEVLILVSGALDVVLEEDGSEPTIALEAGQAAIVPRGVWHRLVMRAPGRLVFINSRAGMQTRPWKGARER